MHKLYQTHSMPETAENVAEEFKVARADQDAFALRSQQRWAAAKAAGKFADEIVPVTLPQKKGGREDSRYRRASARGHYPRDAGQTERHREGGRHGNGRQRFRRQRRRLRAAAGV